MKKSILFIIISILTTVTLLSTAAVCNLCSGLSTIADNIENSQLLQTREKKTAAARQTMLRMTSRRSFLKRLKYQYFMTRNQFTQSKTIPGAIL